MEANELRIGNYVSNGGCETTISYLLPNEIMCHNPDFEGSLNGEITPIPLTEDWLLDFGFGFSYYGEISINNFIMEKFHDGYHYTGGEGVSFGTPIAYVHQLQNLYFALTGEELKMQ